MSHDPSEIILICCFGAQETFLIIINVEFFVIFSGFFDNIINVFIATLDQFNVPLLKKNINFSQKMLLTTNF